MRIHVATTASICVSANWLYVFSYAHYIIKIDDWTYHLPNNNLNDTLEINLLHTIT